MRLRYKAQKSDGSFYEGERESPDKFALSREFASAGETLIQATESKPVAHLHVTIRKLFSFRRRVSMHDKIAFARNLAGMLSAGLTVSRALSVLERQTRSKRFKAVITGLITKISVGENLSRAFSGYPDVFPPILISMVKAGEEGGNLAKSLLAVSDQLDRSYALHRKVKGALMYPGIVIGVMCIVGLVMFIFIVPKLTSAFKEFNVDLPLTTKIVVGISDFLQAHLFLGLGLIVAVACACWVSMRSTRGKRLIDTALLHVPVITPLIRQANAARTGQTLSSLLSAGVEVIHALEITADVLSNHHYRDVLLLARGAIQKGEPMSTIFRAHEDIFPPFLSEMVAVGEETGKLSDMLRETGLFFEAEVDQATKNIATLIEPALMVVVGVVVGFFAVAMISPAYSLMDSI